MVFSGREVQGSASRYSIADPARSDARNQLPARFKLFDAIDVSQLSAVMWTKTDSYV